ncbi:CusA/CzcA family heavy metal efflux RND transporter [Reichenbachiella carrageenanivorans]|uniref:CusA/CzcA family heavy metal efflux RND transporter n=1 Tax=Reichenbachiella carrageenanivorans TaxID=2979869 RepID=A0ABY6CX12_9BACT|nr:CusA/CzcA family heavy metal efflux RND transporter [Reichenbachiella carrageenanivorans]UXX78445.1 CusA/CzcA family heavy metal efflux RND transporter [Reichenbachiella carrageenanivorans]
MLDKIIRFSVDHKLIVGLFTLGLIIWGIFSLAQLPMDAVPDITNNQVQVITTSPTLAAEEVERLITFPVEVTMATIPEIEEIRSFSRFGLSVVTIVFNERVDVYWARQQVNERMAEVEAQIPPNVGRPRLAPVTTGLGEIYQYVISTAPGYESQYDARQLRSIQDWIVRRQLLGTPGVADVSSFGGYLKQYEIAINPDRLNAMQVSIADIFEALESNNENTGGAYIEKNMTALFIRSEGLVGSMEDIENIVIKNHADGIPVLIRDVGKVQLGHAVRYGATTRNGEGEVVSAIVMMLKGENSAEVIKNIKTRIEQIKKTLPEGVTIEPFLDRTKLVNTAISTVTKNLTEGALIVVFVLLLLLGNIRAGLIVASVIPLSLLFAFSMMNLFGVSGNLMSLGAIDFGLIVDGAVIIVEATMHHLGLLKWGRRLTQQEMDDEVYASASKIRNSAAFGEIIILIVYLPILALVGTEGKMFGPMAQTVSFAILGAFLLSLTYVPMASALFLSKKGEHKANVSDKIMAFFHRLYDPLIRWAMYKRPWLLASTLALFTWALYTFSVMGGEFIPTLEEGDFAVETRVITGSSLQNTIQATTQAEQLLLEQFPEVLQVVSKIGSGEIPTDPMPPEAADLMIILKDKSEWESASNREDLANLMSEALEVIPGVTFGFQQPIQMRFNELMTGVRQDVAIKIYGEDLDQLSEYAQQIGAIASGVSGAVDLYLEEVTGVPQIVIDYKRNQLAKYGLHIKEVNQTIQAAFAGASAGLVYEGERRFDLVVRLKEIHRSGLQDVRNLYISRPDGHQIPLYQLADVQIKEGPYQIQRDNTRRRIIVAFNVRNRDVESVVTEMQDKINQSIVFAPGYSVSYGGQFENLIEARQRLSVAVPLALLLIFVLLYFTFQSVKQGILIFTAIPLSAIGGIFALWLRDMPFSISAGVGFIALFGVAVLNGIVLIGEFNQLKKEGVSDVFERVFKGTAIRLRPVIMTASVASLGFLPMALSHSSGAEVQKPLATVVIGGLITATFLTLIVLPILYYYFEKGIKVKPVVALLLIVSLFVANPQKVMAQAAPVVYQSLDEVLDVALVNNPTLKAEDLYVQQQQATKQTSWNLPKTDVRWTHGQYNSVYDNDNQFSISQRFEFPTVYANQSKLAQAKVEHSEQRKAITQNELVKEVKAAWYALWYAKSKALLLKQQDSIYLRYAEAASLRYATGESNLLEKATAQSQVADIEVMLAQNKSDIEILRTRLRTLLDTETVRQADLGYLTAKKFAISPDSVSLAANPTLQWFQGQIDILDQEKVVEKSRLLPDITLGYVNQSLNGPGLDINGTPVNYSSSDRFSSFQIGVALPIFGSKSQLSAVKAAELKKQVSTAQLEAATNEVNGQWRALIQQYKKHRNSLNYYENNALPQADLILAQAQKGFEGGEIGYVEYTQGLDRALNVKFNYFAILNEYNQTLIQIEFISGIQ